MVSSQHERESLLFRVLKKVSAIYLSKPVLVRNNKAREYLNKLGSANINESNDKNENRTKKYIIITSKSAWKYFDKICSVNNDPSGQILLNPPLEYEKLIEIGKKLKNDGIKTIIGIGGGRIMDTSKFFAWYLKKQSFKPQLILIPSITSTTSWLNMGMAIRKDNVLYMPGDYHANKIIYDPEYIKQAPINLNTGGIADLLVCNSALIDWNISYNSERFMRYLNSDSNSKSNSNSDSNFNSNSNSNSNPNPNSKGETIDYLKKHKEHNPFKGTIAFTKFSNKTIEKYTELVSEMKRFEDKSEKVDLKSDSFTIYPDYISNKFIIEIYETFLEALALCGAVMSGRPLEGSEHFFYYALDELDNRTWNHGAIIAFSTLLVLKIQEIFLKNYFSTTKLIKPKKTTRISILFDLYSNISENSIRLKNFYDSLKIRFRPSQLGLDRRDIISIVKNMQDFVVKYDFYPTMWNFFWGFMEKIDKIDKMDKILEDIIDWIEKKD